MGSAAKPCELHINNYRKYRNTNKYATKDKKQVINRQITNWVLIWNKTNTEFRIWIDLDCNLDNEKILEEWTKYQLIVLIERNIETNIPSMLVEASQNNNRSISK